MEHIIQQRTYPPSKNHMPSIRQRGSRAGQSLDNARESSRGFVIHTLPAFLVFVSLLLTFSFVVLIFSIMVGLRVGNTALRPNPFTSYETLWPGASVESVADYAQRITQGYMPCISGASPLHPYAGLEVHVADGAYDTLGEVMNCMTTPHDGIFYWLTMKIGDGQVQELQLFSDVLQQDTLLLYWGAPDAITKADNVLQLNLYWEHGTYSAMASVRQQDSTVQFITLTAKE